MSATTAPKRKKRRPTGPFGGPGGPRRIGIYERRSTDDEHQPFSIEAQDSALTKYAGSQPGWTITAKYSDDASGATTQRPGLQQALADARAGRFDVLLVYRVDRFSRRLSDLLDLLAELDDAGVAFASATEPFDTSTSIGRMLVQLLGVFAEFERETIIDRVTKGMAAKAAKGQWVGGPAPYGLQADRDTWKLHPEPAEAPWLAEIFRLYTRERHGTRNIAAELNRRGARTRTGKPWSAYQISRILANPAYAGDIAYGDVHVENAHQALIDRAIWQRARALATARAESSNPRAASDTDYYLTSLIRCPDCGHNYIGTAATGRNRTYRYYTCYSRNRYGTSGCTGPRLPASQADTAVLTALTGFYTKTPDLIGAAVTRAQAHHTQGHASHQAEHDAALAQAAAKEAAIERYYQAFENGTMDEATTGNRVRKLQNEITQLRARAADIAATLATTPQGPDPATITRLAGYLTDILSSGTPAEQKTAIETLIDEIRITPEGIIPVFKIPQPGTLIPGSNPDTTSTDTVRAPVHSVGRVGIEPTTGEL